MALYVPGAEPALKVPRRYGSRPITPISYEGHTTVTGTPSPDSPATLAPVEPPAIPGAAKQIGPLWSLPDGTKDTYDGETGELVRKIYKIVLNGTENWSASKLETGVYDFKLEGYPFVVGQMDNAIGTNVLSSHFIIAQGLLLYKSSYGQKTEIHLYFTEITTVDGIKAWLSAQAAAGTPVTVLYELAQPTVDHLIYTGPIATRATDILAPSWTGKTTMIGEPSPDNPATISGVPFAATATGPDGQTRSVDLGFTGYSLPDGTRDTYDGVRGDFVQRVGKVIIKGTENIIAFTELENTVRVVIETTPKVFPHENHVMGICNYFDYIYEWELDVPHVYSNLDNQILFVPKNLLSGVEVDDVKSWLSAKAAAGNPVIVLGKLAQPVAYRKKVDITAFDGETTVTGADAVEVIADCLPFEIVRSNQNLILNPYFEINQRGKKSYSLSKYKEYCVDCWFGTTTLAVDVGTSCIELTFAPDNAAQFRQAFERIFDDRPLTVSFLLEASEETRVNFGFYAVKKNLQQYKDKIVIIPKGKSLLTMTSDFLANKTTEHGIFFHADSGKIKIYPPKLEYGTNQTNVRKIGDQWVLNDPPPDPALELLKCQRYLVSYKSTDVQNSSVFFGTGVLDGVNPSGHTTGQGLIILPCTMRAKPTITGSVNVYNSRVNAPINVVDIQGVSGNIMRLNFAVLHELPLDERMCLLWGSGDVLIGAEL